MRKSFEERYAKLHDAAVTMSYEMGGERFYEVATSYNTSYEVKAVQGDWRDWVAVECDCKAFAYSRDIEGCIHIHKVNETLGNLGKLGNQMKVFNNGELMIGPVRLSYLTVFSPRPRTKDDKSIVLEYSATLLLPKVACDQCKDPGAEMTAFKEAITNVYVDKFGKKAAEGKWRRPWRDGDNEEDGAKYPGYMFMNTSAKEDFPPLLINGAKHEAKRQDGWQSGDWGYVRVRPYAYDQAGNKGVGLGLSAIQFLYKGEPMGGGGRASADEFDVVADATLKVEGAAPTVDDSDPFSGN